MNRSLSFAVLLLSVVACGDSTNPSGDRVAEVMLMMNGHEADSVYHVDYFGQLDLNAIALNSSRVELPPTSYTIQWSSSDATVASVSSGRVNTSKDGSAWIIARSATFADSVRFAVVQVARKARLRQDTVVALTAGATKLSGGAVDQTVQKPDTLRFEAYITDVAGSPATSGANITYTNLDPSLFTIVPNTRGDTVKIIGIAPGSGKIALEFLTFKDTVRVQVVSSYALVQLTQGLGSVGISPSDVSIPPGAAVLFQNGLVGGNFLVSGAGWSAGPIPSRLREANVFSQPGTFTYTVSNSSATVTVTP